ncbi:MAG: hypothetical protein KBD63_03230 [Bacteriovoracaceae bacterium]|nr:hypothetical protein [Bacteriovoracaceae bacterium]
MKKIVSALKNTTVQFVIVLILLMAYAFYRSWHWYHPKFPVTKIIP